MSWLLENWFGSKQGLEDVREDVQRFLQRESYFGVSGIEQPEQSQNRIPSNELVLSLNAPWHENLEEFETELLQFIHDEMPSVVRDELGVIPFFTNVLEDGYLVLAFVRNATLRTARIPEIPMVLTTEDGEVVARKSFDLLPLGAITPHSSTLVPFVFRWEEFGNLPPEEVPLFLALDLEKYEQAKMSDELVKQNNGLTEEEEAKYRSAVEKFGPAIEDDVDIHVLGIEQVNEGGMKVIVLFRNGLGKGLEFTEVPIYVQDHAGREVAHINYGMKNLRLAAQECKLWGFYIPVDSMKREISASECIAYVPQAQQGNGSNLAAKKPNAPIQ